MNKNRLLKLDNLYEMAGGDFRFLNKVAEEFELVANETLHQLKAGISTENISAIRTAVHRIKPNFSYVGMEDQAHIASMIIVKIDHGQNKEEIMAMVRALKSDIKLAISEVEDVKSTWS